MKELFYSETERTIFWVAGYTWDNNTSVLSEKIKSLEENRDKFFEVVKNCGKSKDLICTDDINKSRRYKSMRVFWISDVDNVADAFVISAKNNWTMWKWLND